MKALMVVATLAVGGVVPGGGQEFTNLDFEQAVVRIPLGCHDCQQFGFLPWGEAAPGWSHISTNDTGTVYYNSPHIGATPFYLLMDLRSPYYAPDTHLSGQYSLAFTSGTTGPGWITAYIAQTGRIPAGTKYLQMLARGPFRVLINDTPIEMQSTGGEGYWADVSAFADSVTELKIVNTGTIPHEVTVVDNILFSPDLVLPPERIDYRGGNYTQDFNSLPGGVIAQANTRMPDAWKLWPEEYYWTSVSSGLNPGYRAYAVSESAGAVDQAFAFYGGDFRLGYLGAEIRNDTGSTLASFTVSYWVEQWSKGLIPTDVVSIPFEYSLAATNLRIGTFTRVEAGGIAAVHAEDENELSPIPQGLIGNDPANRRWITATVSGISWIPEQSLWLRWVREVPPCFGYCQLLAIDDLTFTAVPTLQITPIPQGSFRLSWSTNYPSFRLQSGMDLSGDQWTDVSNLPVRNGDQFEATLEPTAEKRFFRLVY